MVMLGNWENLKITTVKLRAILIWFHPYDEVFELTTVRKENYTYHTPTLLCLRRHWRLLVTCQAVGWLLQPIYNSPTRLEEDLRGNEDTAVVAAPSANVGCINSSTVSSSEDTNVHLEASPCRWNIWRLLPRSGKLS